MSPKSRLAKGFEALVETATVWLMLGSVKLFMQGLANG